jgi:hypothetical protein
MAKDKHDKALHILAKYHANGNENHPTVQFEFVEIKETIRLEFENKKSSSYLDFFRTKGNRYRFAVLLSLGIFSQWSGNAIISNYSAKLYTSAGVSESTPQLGLAAGQTCLALIVSISMALLVDKVGRRPMFLASTGGMFGTFIFWTLCSALYDTYRSPGSGQAMIFFIWVFGFMYSLAWSGLLVGYAVEILPYKLRAKGLMIMNIAIQVALTLNTYANPVAFKYFEEQGNTTWKLYLIYTVRNPRKHSSHIPSKELTHCLDNYSAGSSSNFASFTSCTSRPRVPRSRSSPRSSTETRPKSPTSTSTRSRRRYSLPRRMLEHCHFQRLDSFTSLGAATCTCCVGLGFLVLGKQQVAWFIG